MDKAYADILNDVTIRFKAHQSYKTKEGALKALIKRTKAFTGILPAQDLELACVIYDKAVELIGSENYTDRSRNTTTYSAYEDIQFEKCVHELKQQIPTTDDGLTSLILNWVIFWHYLK